MSPFGLFKRENVDPQDAPALPASHYHDLQAEQTRMLFRNMPTMGALEPLCAGVIVWLFWNTGPSHVALAVWATLLVGVVFMRMTGNILFNYLRPSSDQITWWRRAALALIILSGALISYASVEFNTPSELFSTELIARHLTFYALIVALVIVSLITYGVYFPATAWYVTSVLAPQTVYLFLSAHGDNAFFMQVLALIDFAFLVFVLLAALKLNRTIADSLKLQFKNMALIDFLNRARTDAEELNQKLSQEILERKQAKLHLQEAHDRLETMVKERTQALEKTNDKLSASQQRLQLAIEASNIGLWDWNLATGETYHSNFDKLLGYPSDHFKSFVGDLEPLVHPDDFQRVRRAMVEHFKGRTSFYLATYRIRHANGDWRWLEDEGRVVEWNENGNASRMIGTRRDITEDKEAEEQMRLAATVFDHASEGIFILDADYRYLAINDYFTRISGFTEEDTLNQLVTVTTDDELHGAAYAAIRDALDAEGFWKGEITGLRKNGETYPQWLQLTSVYDTKGNITHYVGMFSDLTMRKQTEERLQFLSNYDRLTGFANRNLFREQLHKSLTLARLNRQKLALLYMDLDRFKNINDTLGHEIGDRLLAIVAERFQGLEVPQENIARVGGDEFTIVIEAYQSEEKLNALIEEIIGIMKRPFHIDNHELLLGISIGVSIFPDSAKEAQMLINQADLAMHQAKRLGGNTFQFYHNDMRVASVEQLALETSLRKAIFKNEFVVFFQPKLDLRTGSIARAEALVRWQHPTMGLLPPGEFIPLAEETGLIAAIGELVMERACSLAQKWRSQGLGDVHISVNMSAHQFRKSNIVETVDRILESSRLPPHLLELELTESLIMEDMDKNIELLKEIRKRGIEISLDDFGTGYSSLSYLKLFPIDTLKIDRAFIKDMHQSRDDAAITRAIIDMAHSLNLKVVAEGVELKEQMAMLQKMECDSIQGYLISKPVPDDDFADQLKAQQANPHALLKKASE